MAKKDIPSQQELEAIAALSMSKEAQDAKAKEIFNQLYHKMFCNYGMDWRYSYFWAEMARRCEKMAKRT